MIIECNEEERQCHFHFLDATVTFHFFGLICNEEEEWVSNKIQMTLSLSLFHMSLLPFRYLFHLLDVNFTFQVSLSPFRRHFFFHFFLELVVMRREGGCQIKFKCLPLWKRFGSTGGRVQTKTKGLASSLLSPSLSNALVHASVIAMHYLSL